MYIVGAQALGTVNANSTVRNLPKPPQGDKTAWISPPTEFPFSKPVFQESVYTAEAAKMTPMECAENYRFCWLVIELEEAVEDGRKGRTLETKKPKYVYTKIRVLEALALWYTP